MTQRMWGGKGEGKKVKRLLLEREVKKLLVGTSCQSGPESRQSAVAPATSRSACLHVWLVGVATVGEGNPSISIWK